MQITGTSYGASGRVAIRRRATWWKNVESCILVNRQKVIGGLTAIGMALVTFAYAMFGNYPVRVR
jgi:hypothetical protein